MKVSRDSVAPPLPPAGSASPNWRFFSLGMVSGVKGRYVSPCPKKTRKFLMPDFCNFVLKSNKLSINFSAPPLSVHGLKSLLFVGEAWNLIGKVKGPYFDT